MYRRSTLAVLTAALALAFAPSALAGHQFTDVPDTHPFHTEIGIFKETNITSGCTATTFCPNDYVKRQAMAAFIDRALGLVVRPGETTQKGVPGSRVALLDDDLSFAGTHGNAFAYRGPSDNVAGGFSGNSVTAGVFGATIAGGGDSSFPNSVSDDWGSVGGGAGNRAGDGAGTTSDRPFATVAGGVTNTASSFASAVAGGQSNTASGTFSAVAGGRLNTAAGNYSFAAGRRAKANHQGAFVWADSQNFDFPTGENNSFNVRATGGVDFVTGINTTTGSATSGVGVAAGSGSWSSYSDRKAKRDFRGVDGDSLLRRLAQVPISTWSYKAQKPTVRHIGPTAQDFARAFGVGESDRRIATIDADGVALAAIQALHRQNVTLRQKVERLEQQNKRLSALERTVVKLTRESK